MARGFIHINLRLKGLSALNAAFGRGTPAGRSGPVDAMYQQWGRRYESFVRRRFIASSRGGGDWPPLARSTMLARRGGGGKTFGQVRTKFKRAKTASQISKAHAAGQRILSRVSILRDTGTLFNATAIGAIGNFFGRIANGVRYGFASQKHVRRVMAKEQFKDIKGKAKTRAVRGLMGSGVTIAQIASYHQKGGPRLPRRVILAPPDAQTKAGMMNDLRACVGRLARSAEGGGA